MTPGIVAVTVPLRDEVLDAVQAVQRPNCVYVSRGTLEDEIDAHPERYPILGDVSRPFRRQVITKVMKHRFAYWGENTSRRRRSFVWDITRKGEAEA
jgi:hypothetical protein